jgi:hypothetical protein
VTEIIVFLYLVNIITHIAKFILIVECRILYYYRHNSDSLLTAGVILLRNTAVSKTVVLQDEDIM